MLELKGIQKSFFSGLTPTEAVRELDLQIPSGEFFSLLGPSGCGKTTLLRMISGLENPSRGEIWLDGKRIDSLPANQRQFNLVFQRYALFPHLNIRENVAFGLEVKGVGAAEIQERVEEVLALVQLQALSSRSIDTLSGGQQQRVALARALVNRPKILLLDEPLSALDLKLRQQMQIELRALQKRLGNTFIFVTHDQEEALTLSDRIAVMNQGKVEQVGTPQEIYEFPRSRFVAGFIGQMNVLAGDVKERRADAVEVSGASKRPILVRPSRDGSRPLANVSAGERIEVMIRPEKLKVLKSAPGPEQNSIEGVLKDSLYLGPVTQFFVQPKDPLLPILHVTQPNSAMTARRSFHSGDRVFVAWAPEDCLLMSTHEMENGVPAQADSVVESIKMGSLAQT